MADMITSMITSFGGPVLEDLGKRVGLPPDIVKKVAPLGIAAVLSGVKRIAAQPGGADALSSLFKSATDTVGTDLDAYAKGFDPAKSASMLNTLAGSNSVENVTANLARVAGISPDSMGKMMGFLGPAAVSGLGAMAKENGLDAKGVVDLLDQNSDAFKALGDLDYLLDDVPGIGDDISRGLKKLFGG